MDLNVPIHVKNECSAQLVRTKLEEFREKKQGVVIPSKVTVKDIKKNVSTTKKKED